MAWIVAGGQHRGGRAEQQDRWAVQRRADGLLLMVADGMGGGHAGGRAAELVIEQARAMPEDPNPEDRQQRLVALCHAAHAALLEEAERQGASMGSTLVALWLGPDHRAWWVNVGASRLYQWREGQMMFHTQAHRLDRLPGHGGAGAHQLYMCLGGKNPLAPDSGRLHWRRGDLFLLGSDGYWNQADQEQTGRRLMRSWRFSRRLEQLVEAAARRGGEGSDNVTLLAARASRWPWGRFP